MEVNTIRRATDEEMLDHWGDAIHPNPFVVELENGNVLMPAQDPELNGAGHLLGQKPNGDLYDFVETGENE